MPLFHRLVTKVTLAIFVLSFIVFSIALGVAYVNEGDGYASFVYSRVVTYHNLQFSLLISGLLLIMATSLFIWLVSLMLSFKVAGPLYRFSENLSVLSAKQNKITGIRTNDYFHDVSDLLFRAVANVKDHKDKLGNALDDCIKNMESPEPDKELIVRNLKKLRTIASEIKINEKH